MLSKEEQRIIYENYDVNVVIYDTSDPSKIPLEINQCEKRNTLSINNTFEHLIIGPLYQEKPGCSSCLNQRFLNTRRDRKYINQRNENSKYNPIQSHIFNHLLDVFIPLIINQAEEGYQKKVYIINKNTLEVTMNLLTPVPDCSTCSKLKPDSEKSTFEGFKEVISELSSDKFIPMRSANFIHLKENIELIALDRFLGIFNVLLENTEGPFPVAVANLPLKNGKDEVGVGRTDNMLESKAVALLEGMERYAGMQPRGKETSIFSTYNDVKSKAVNPDELILHKHSIQLESPYKNNQFIFSEDELYHWVWSYNLSKEQPELIPEIYAYYGLNLKDSKYHSEQFVYEISNGCALGSTLLESSFYGLLEVVERDAFLVHWYFNTSVIEIKIDDDFLGNSSNLAINIKQFNSHYEDYKLRFFNISVDTKIPVVLATVHSKEYHQKKMNFMCAAAAHPNILTAMERAMHEISGIFFGLQKKFNERHLDLLEIADDPSKVLTMEDHSLFYGLYSKRGFINYDARISKEVLASDLTTEKDYDMRKEFNKALNILKGLSKDVIVVDQTTEEMKEMSLRCTKTIVPGLLPMTFGTHNIRISKKRVLEIEEFYDSKVNLNFSPHPFP